MAPFVRSKAFEVISYLAVLGSVAMISWDRWRDPRDAEEVVVPEGWYVGHLLGTFAELPSYTLPQLAVGSAAASTLFFSVEAVLKVVVMRPSLYWANPWCRLELALLVTALADQATAPLVPSLSLTIRMLDSLTTLRLLRLLKPLTQGTQLLRSLLLMLPALFNVLSLLGLLLYVYALVGLRLF